MYLMARIGMREFERGRGGREVFFLFLSFFLFHTHTRILPLTFSCISIVFFLFIEHFNPTLNGVNSV